MIDIADLDLGGVDVISRVCGLVGVAKHLCGAATDLALRCLLDTVPKSSTSDTKTQTTSKLLGVAMAMCCHHRCTWSALVGKGFLEECGFLPEEFPLLCQLTSWAVCGVRPPTDTGGWGWSGWD